MAREDFNLLETLKKFVSRIHFLHLLNNKPRENRDFYKDFYQESGADKFGIIKKHCQYIVKEQ